MNDRAEVVIVGGGIMGVSLAYALTQLGVSDVLVLERHSLAAGASGKTGALLRLHYSNVPEATLAYRSYQTFANWPEIIGGDCGFVKSGIVVTVATRGEHAGNRERLQRNVALQNEIGITSRVISADELYELQPFLNVDDIDLAAYEPDSGYVDAVAATRSMAEAAIRGGARIVEGCRVTGLRSAGGRLAGVETTSGPVDAESVVLAAGAWSADLCANLGIAVPVEALRVQVAIVTRPLAMPASGTMSYVDTAAGIFLRDWGPNRTLVGIGGGEFHDVVAPDGWDERPDSGYARAAIERLCHRMPAMSQASYLSGHAGIYDMTPDAHPILDRVAHPDNLYIMAGFSGAGFKKGPASGQAMAELIVNGHSSLVDLAPFRLSRFDDDSWKTPWSPDEYTFSADFGHGL